MEERHLTLYRRLTLFAATACIAFLMAAALKETMFEEWREYQRMYREVRVMNALTRSDSILSDSPIAVDQIVLPALGRIDRCISCHQGIEDTLFARAPLPLTAHSGSYLSTHDIGTFGCTLCHGGNGRVLAVLEVCGRDSVERDPARSLAFVQAGCAQCHGTLFSDEPPVAGTEKVTLGRSIVRTEGCLGCHTIRGTGGVAGPDLTNQGSKSRHQYRYDRLAGERTVVNWLRSHFADPAAITPGSAMIPVRLSPDSMNALVTFLLGLRAPELPIEYYASDRLLEVKSRKTLPNGGQVYSTFCSGCHGKEGGGRPYTLPPFGTPALSNPDFQAVASRAFLDFTIRSGRSGRRMASWSEAVSGVRDNELALVGAFVRDWRADGPTINDVRSSRGIVREGKDLFERACIACHPAGGRPGAAPSVDNPQFLSAASDEFLVRTIVNGRENTAMPSWARLTSTELASILSYLRSFGRESSHSGWDGPAAGDPDSGALFFSGYCVRCHGREGMGGIGPAILNPDFIRSASPRFLRMTIGSGRNHTAMFGWRQSLSRTPAGSATTLEDIVAFMLSRRDSVPDRVYPGESVGRPIQGKELYTRHCAECHGSNGEGLQAPALNNQEFLNAASNGFLLATMTLGRGGTAMPSWGRGDETHQALTIEERQDIVAHIRLWQEFVIRREPAERQSGRRAPVHAPVSSGP